MVYSLVSTLAFLTGVEAGTLAVTWEDCGATHAKVDDLQPTTIETGSTTTLVGTGVVDEEVTSAQFTAVIKALGVKISDCSGDATSDIVCKLPAGAGEVTVKAVSYPLPAGKVDIPVDVKTSVLIPASLAKVDVHIEATEQNGESVICLDVHTAKQLETTGVDCSTAVCKDQCDCSNDKCADELATCLSDDTCAAAQTCALACPCSDNSCILKCAAANPSAKALPAAVCINSKCGSTLSAAADVDCTTAACPDQCACGLDKCADAIDTCLADATCAQGQACALACPCSDTACSLKCAAANPSAKALPVATCLNSNCASMVV